MSSQRSTKQTVLIMGMPIQIEIVGNKAEGKDFKKIFDYFRWVDKTFSPFKDTSEVSKFNRGEKYSFDLKEILKLAQKTKKETGGYFDVVRPDGKMDPSGIVKGWAIYEASKILKKEGFCNFYIDAGGDAEISGKNKKGKKWTWGIKNPFNPTEIIKVLFLADCGIATSGTYERGPHIYNPLAKNLEESEIVSLTIIGPNVYEADRFATPAFAMGKKGIEFIDSQAGLEGYMINKNGIATYTKGFEKYI